MSATTTPRETLKKAGDIVAYGVGAVLILKGTLVVIRSDGYLYPLRAPATSQSDVFAGVAFETVDNSAGVAGAKLCRVEKTGAFNFAKASAAQTDIGLVAFYGADNQTVSATTTNAILVGYATQLVDSATLKIRIDRAVN